jgi:hypothetical protein
MYGEEGAEDPQPAARVVLAMIRRRACTQVTTANVRQLNGASPIIRIMEAAA